MEFFYCCNKGLFFTINKIKLLGSAGSNPIVAIAGENQHLLLINSYMHIRKIYSSLVG